MGLVAKIETYGVNRHINLYPRIAIIGNSKTKTYTKTKTTSVMNTLFVKSWHLNNPYRLPFSHVPHQLYDLNSTY